MELKATNPAQYSESPFARSFQTITIAIHLASPIIIIPYIYGRFELSFPGKSLMKTIANVNIRTGPIIQFWTSESPRILKFLKTPPSSSYLTLASGGYIIRINPIAIGMFVVLSGDDFNESQKAAIAGKKYPDPTPMNIARKIQRVRYLSRNLSLGFILKRLKLIMVFLRKLLY